jgi:hypothetical protein
MAKNDRIKLDSRSCSREEALRILFSAQQKEKLAKSYERYEKEGGIPFGQVLGNI